ncbi:hypothetical protein JTB14_004855 [Gonioctena quinquepunctata]|nr:hypothetical protein JTB14_004855 [Gonioctena quinquepunctata]
MRPLHMEHELEEAGIMDENNEIGNDDRIQSWVEKPERLWGTRESFQFLKKIVILLKVSDKMGNTIAPFQKSLNLKKIMTSICYVSKVIEGVNPGDLKYGEFLAGQIVDEDVTIFDGNPEDWSLFKKQFQLITGMCGYNEADIMGKLGRQSKVSGMMIENL